MTEGRFREVNWAEGRPKDVLAGAERGLAVRVIEKGGQGFASANDVSPAAARILWERARDAARRVPPDERRRLPRPIRVDGVPERNGLLFRPSVDELQERLARHEKDLLAVDRRIRKILRLSFHESQGVFTVANSRGVSAEEASSSVSVAVELLGEEKGDARVAWDSSEARGWESLDEHRPLRDARERLAGSFGARAIPSGAYPVIVASRVGADFLELLSGALVADAVQRGRSFLAGKRGRTVASRSVTVVDDGRFPGGMASALYDEEGVPTRRAVLLERGVLRDFLYDSYTAAREGRRSSGNAVRPGLGGPPEPGPGNFYLAPGDSSREAITAESGRAFLVEDVLGMHTADPVSGDFSVGASGRLVEKGRPGRAVKGVTLAGNVLDLLRKVDAVARDLTWHGAFGSPTFRVSGLSIGGS